MVFVKQMVIPVYCLVYCAVVSCSSGHAIHHRGPNDRPFDDPITALGYNVSSLLNSLLYGYDKDLRPGYGGSPVLVETDILVRSMGPISEAEMAFSLDCYFRQTWSDPRLAFDSLNETLAFNYKMLERIWKPDTFFFNSRFSFVNTITTPNKLLRIQRNGTILYSMRLTIRAGCPMYLHYYPIDRQQCPLTFGSYGYTVDDVIYKWKFGPGKSVVIIDNMRLSQFDLIGHPITSERKFNLKGFHSTLHVVFTLQRHTGSFLLDVYFPCSLLVVVSWVSFWINREATSDRVSLGITTVLSLATMNLDTRNDLPQVPYPTAMDWFMLMCYFFVIATLLEFAVVHYFTKICSGDIHGDDDTEDENEVNDYNDTQSTKHSSSEPCQINPRTRLIRRPCQIRRDRFVKHTYMKSSKPTESFLLKFFYCLTGNAEYRTLLKSRHRADGVNSVSIIDRVSRRMFPASFITLNAIFWIVYIRGPSSQVPN